MNIDINGRNTQPLPLAQVWERGALTTGPSSIELTRGVFSRAITNLFASPVTSLLTSITVSCVLSVFAVMMFLFENLKTRVDSVQDEARVHLFLKDGVDENGIQSFSNELQVLPGVLKIAFTDKTQALKQFKEMLGKDAELTLGLENDNPLPASLDVTLNKSDHAEADLKQLEEKYKNDPRVERIQNNHGLISQFRGAVTLLRFFSIGVGVVFFAIGIAIIYNTIRLALFAHRQEIEVMELMGARPGAIQAPYLIEGMIHGVLGSFGATIMMTLMYGAMTQAHARADFAKLFLPELVFLSGFTLLLLTFLGMAIGVIGSYVAVKRFLERE